MLRGWRFGSRHAAAGGGNVRVSDGPRQLSGSGGLGQYLQLYGLFPGRVVSHSNRILLNHGACILGLESGWLFCAFSFLSSRGEIFGYGLLTRCVCHSAVTFTNGQKARMYQMWDDYRAAYQEVS